MKILKIKSIRTTRIGDDIKFVTLHAVRLDNHAEVFITAPTREQVKIQLWMLEQMISDGVVVIDKNQDKN